MHYKPSVSLAGIITTNSAGCPKKDVNNFDDLSLIVEKSEISERYFVGKINLKLRFWCLVCYN